jgi:hypothetical protein
MERPHRRSLTPSAKDRALLLKLLTKEIFMSRFAFLFSFAALLATGEIALADQPIQTKERLACAATGIDPASPAFAQCVVDLDQSLSQEQSISGR